MPATSEQMHLSSDARGTRIDKWLWAVRLFKTRTLAAEACRKGKVRVRENLVKASREIKIGDVIEVQLSDLTRTVRVIRNLENRVGAKSVADFAEDLTPVGEYLRQIENRRLAAPKRPEGAGRPTKKERRDLDAFKEGPFEF